MRFRFFQTHRVRLLLGFSTLVILALAVLRCLDRGFSHDEHQFIVPAVLTAREGALPYRDYALFHQPYQIALNALGVWLGGWPLLMGRLTAGLASAGTLGLLFFLAWSRSRERPTIQRFALSWIAVFLIIGSPLFLQTSGRSWNHDLPTFLALAAAFLALTARSRGQSIRWLAVGLLGGLTVGTRLTFAPFALLLAFIPFFHGEGALTERFRSSMFLCLGTVAALSPSLWLLKLAPVDYLFGNFEYPQVPFMENARGIIPPPLSSFAKASYFFEKVAVPDAPLFLAVIAGGIPAIFGLWRGQKDGGGVILLILAAPLVIGAIAPARPHEQYFYTPAIFGFAALLWALPKLRMGQLVFLAALALVPLTWEGKNIVEWDDIFRPGNWTINKIHDSGLELRRIVGSGEGRVLTLSPTIAAEAGLKIYPELALGQFGWRCADLFTDTRRHELRLLGPNDLESRLSTEPPRAILTDIKEQRLEEPLIAYAQAHGYRSRIIKKKMVVWLPPDSAPNSVLGN